MKLMVCSPSTLKYAREQFPDYKHIHIVKNPPTKRILERKNTVDDVIAIGGGSVIDTAKIICKGTILAIPTTYSGASGTSHAVYWNNGIKMNVDTCIPKTMLKEEYLNNLPKEVEVASKIDCLCHIIESLISSKSTKESTNIALEAIDNIKQGDWLRGSILAGNCIEITGTNLIHRLSYGLTGKYNLPHGVSLLHILNLASRYKKVNELL